MAEYCNDDVGRPKGGHARILWIQAELATQLRGDSTPVGDLPMNLPIHSRISMRDSWASRPRLVDS